MEQGQTIRVLLVDDIPEVRENLRKLLYFERDIEVVGIASNGEEAVAKAREAVPDIVLMDINMPVMDGIAASEAISAEFPRIQIIMMSVQGETDYLRRSMLAGAKGFLIKPFGSDEMTSTIRNVYSLMPKPEPMAAPPPQYVAHQPSVPYVAPAARREQGHLIVVYSPKGGVGCSTVATNLAIALRSIADQKTTLVDCSLQFGDIGVLLNLSSEHTITELANNLGAMDTDLLDGVLTPHLSGTRVLLGPERPVEADLITAEHVREMLRILQAMSTYVVVDTGSELNEVVLSAFDMADRILLVITPDIPAIKSARLFFDVVDELQLQYPEEKIHLVLNQVDRQSTIGPKEIASSMKQKVRAIIPADPRAAQAAANQGTPCVVNNGSSPLAQSMIKLAQAYAQEMAPMDAEGAAGTEKKESGGLFARLRRR
jgi:pilus assembly protein CpaE